MSEQPLVSIGVPVYNGGARLRRALTALASQSHRNLEIVVSDNASTDDTEAIARELANHDRRISYHRNEVNIGAARNIEKVLHLTKGEFFMWAAHDDLWHTDFVAANLERLQRDPEVIASMSRVVLIDGDKVVPRSHWGYAELGTNALMQSTADNLRHYIFRPGLNARFYALFRRRVLLAAAPMDDYCCSDFSFIVKTLAFGKYAEVDRELFFRSIGGATWDFLDRMAHGQRSRLERWLPLWRCTKDIVSMNHVKITARLVNSLVFLNWHFTWHLLKAKIFWALSGSQRLS